MGRRQEDSPRSSVQRIAYSGQAIRGKFEQSIVESWKDNPGPQIKVWGLRYAPRGHPPTTCECRQADSAKKTLNHQAIFAKANWKYYKCIYAQFLAKLSRPAFSRSSGDITMWNSTSASNTRNHGSAILGTAEGPATSAMMITPRRPSYFGKVHGLGPDII